MPFQRTIFDGIGPFVWVGIGIGGRWLYGLAFDAPAASASELIVTGTILGTACYALTVIGPMVTGLLFRRRGD
jgi:hypothetical protein